MNKKLITALIVICLTAALLFWVGVGPYSSGSAVADLKAELESIHGREYTGKAVEQGTEDMIFSVTPRTWFLTNWNLRNTFGMDYEYECKVVFTTHTEDGSEKKRTITYQGIDPMGTENESERAYLDLDTKKEN